MRTTRPPFRSHRDSGASGAASQSARPGGEKDGAHDHARHEQPPEMMFQPGERIAFHGHRLFLK